MPCTRLHGRRLGVQCGYSKWRSGRMRKGMGSCTVSWVPNSQHDCSAASIRLVLVVLLKLHEVCIAHCPQGANLSSIIARSSTFEFLSRVQDLIEMRALMYNRGFSGLHDDNQGIRSIVYRESTYPRCFKLLPCLLKSLKRFHNFEEIIPRISF